MPYRSAWMTPELSAFRDQFRRFLTAELAPRAESWRRAKMVDRDAWRGLGQMGALLPSVPEPYGGGGTFAFEAAVIEDISALLPEMATGVSVHSAIVAHYILNYGSEEQKRRWLPKMARGDFIGAIAMTEPGAGSDLQAVRTTARRRGNAYVLNGQKTFITNGHAADLVIVVARTGGPGAKGLSLLVLETAECAGFRRGRSLDKIGLHASDTSELFFDDAVVPPENLLGERGRPRLRAIDAAIAAGAADPRGCLGRGDGERDRADRRLHQAAHRRSASRCSNSRTPRSSWPSARPRRRSRGCSSIIASSA